MRVKKKSSKLSVHAIAGSRVVMLHMDLPKATASKCLGFSIHRSDGVRADWLKGLRVFEETDPGVPAGTAVRSDSFPFQDFSWSDYAVEPGKDYTYRVVARGGTPHALTDLDEVTVTVTAEPDEGATHSIWFNRGVAASQAYARRFGVRSPSDVGAPALRWLSRGVEESIVSFIEEAKGGDWSLRVSAYEFRHDGVAGALAAAIGRGVDVQIVYDATKDGQAQDFPTSDNRATAKQHTLKAAVITERKTKPKAISHHKFIVLARKGKAKAVLTGSTNFSEGGIYGQSNVVHICRDAGVASAYADAWQLLHDNPEGHRKDFAVAFDALPLDPPDASRPVILPVFSPRSDESAMDHYAQLVTDAKEGVFATFAFGMNDVFREAFRQSGAPVRYVSLEKLFQSGSNEQRNAQVAAEMRALRAMPENRFAVGAILGDGAFDTWVKERLSGMNTHVKFIHTKFMLIDPLGPDPVVVTGSANFSAASSVDNDENMLIIHGDSRVADIYLGEFMRIWEHHAFREWASSRSAKARSAPWWLVPDGKWTARFYGNGPQDAHRRFFSAS